MLVVIIAIVLGVVLSSGGAAAAESSRRATSAASARPEARPRRLRSPARPTRMPSSRGFRRRGSRWAIRTRPSTWRCSSTCSARSAATTRPTTCRRSSPSTSATARCSSRSSRGRSSVPQSFSGRLGLIAASYQNKGFQYAKVLYDNQGTEETGWLNGQMMANIAASVNGLNLAQWQADTNSSAPKSIASQVDAARQDPERGRNADGVRRAEGRQAPARRIRRHRAQPPADRAGDQRRARALVARPSRAKVRKERAFSA